MYPPKHFVLMVSIVLTVAAPLFVRGQSEVDELMREVLLRRNANWEDLYRHTVRDREVLEVTGPDGRAIEGVHTESVWYVREGYMVRSPVRIDGVAVSDEDRERAEQAFLERVREREAERADAATAAEGNPEREHFLGFPYEPGRYLLVGREPFEGRETLLIEYYPQKLFEDDESADGAEAPDPEDLEWQRRFAKTSRILLWVLPEERQIVKVEYDNVGLDFLPLRWLVQVDDVGATLIMDRPFAAEDVWLPREIVIRGALTTANGPLTVDYRLEYFDYREAEIEARVRYRLPGEQRERR